MSVCRNKHFINRLPHIYEIDELLDFCKSHEKLYIYGRNEYQEWILKYLDMCGVGDRVSGYIITYGSTEGDFCYRKLPVLLACDFFETKKDNDKKSGIILGLSEKYYGDVIPVLREKGCDFFQMTEFSRLGIAEQVAPRTREEMTFEVSLADHCNLSCQMCDHFSQLSDTWFVDVEQFKKDMAQMGKIYDHEIGAITLLGGEPTLHPSLIELIKITRAEFPKAQLILLTNGVLLLQLEKSESGNLWETLKEYNVNVTVTVYPIKLDYIAIENKAKEYGIQLKMSSDIHAVEATKRVKISDKHTMNLDGNVPKEHCVHCLYFNKFNVLKDGKYYMCPVQAHIDIFNKKFGKNLEYAEGDYLDIYKVKDWHEFAEFSSWWVPFCRFCDQKNWKHASNWKASNLSIEEYV